MSSSSLAPPTATPLAPPYHNVLYNAPASHELFLDMSQPKQLISPSLTTTTTHTQLVTTTTTTTNLCPHGQCLGDCKVYGCKHFPPPRDLHDKGITCADGAFLGSCTNVKCMHYPCSHIATQPGEYCRVRGCPQYVCKHGNPPGSCVQFECWATRCVHGNPGGQCKASPLCSSLCRLHGKQLSKCTDVACRQHDSPRVVGTARRSVRPTVGALQPATTRSQHATTTTTTTKDGLYFVYNDKHEWGVDMDKFRRSRTEAAQNLGPEVHKHDVLRFTAQARSRADVATVRLHHVMWPFAARCLAHFSGWRNSKAAANNGVAGLTADDPRLWSVYRAWARQKLAKLETRAITQAKPVMNGIGVDSSAVVLRDAKALDSDSDSDTDNDSVSDKDEDYRPPRSLGTLPRGSVRPAGPSSSSSPPQHPAAPLVESDPSLRTSLQCQLEQIKARLDLFEEPTAHLRATVTEVQSRLTSLERSMPLTRPVPSIVDDAITAKVGPWMAQTSEVMKQLGVHSKAIMEHTRAEYRAEIAQQALQYAQKMEAVLDATTAECARLDSQRRASDTAHNTARNILATEIKSRIDTQLEEQRKAQEEVALQRLDALYRKLTGESGSAVAKLGLRLDAVETAAIVLEAGLENHNDKLHDIDGRLRDAYALAVSLHTDMDGIRSRMDSIEGRLVATPAKDAPAVVQVPAAPRMDKRRSQSAPPPSPVYIEAFWRDAATEPPAVCDQPTGVVAVDSAEAPVDVYEFPGSEESRQPAAIEAPRVSEVQPAATESKEASHTEYRGYTQDESLVLDPCCGCRMECSLLYGCPCMLGPSATGCVERDSNYHPKCGCNVIGCTSREQLASAQPGTGRSKRRRVSKY